MEARYGPEISGIRIIPEADDKAICQATMHAAYTIGTAVAAHDPDSEFAQAMFEAQVLGRDLRNYINTVDAGLDEGDQYGGLHATMTNVTAATLATAFAPAGSEHEEMDAAAAEWRSIYDGIVNDTSQRARELARHPTRDVPEDPWA